MKKRFPAMILAIIILSLCLPAALADVIWMPSDDFFYAHQKECVETDRRYEAAADVHSYDEPDGTVGGNIPAGTEQVVSYTWKDQWGLTEVYSGFGSQSQWIRLSEFRRLYDLRDFLADHREEMISAGGSIYLYSDAPGITWNTGEDAADAEADKRPETGAYDIVIWEYPGSDRTVRVLVREQVAGDPEEGAESLRFGRIWTDASGRVWAYLDTYFRGRIEGWVCLSDMSSREPLFVTERYADGADAMPSPEPILTEEEDPDGQSRGIGGMVDPGSDGTRPPVLPIVAVCAVTLLTAALLIIMRQKKKAS